MDEEIQKFVDRHKRYLRNRMESLSKVRLPDLSDGGSVLLLGKEYTVERNASVESFSIDGNTLKVPNVFYPWETEKFLKNLLYPYVRTLTEQYSKKYGLDYSCVRLHTPSSAWGTYGVQDRSIMYNVALAFVPKECIEYIVVHELCHSRHPNHRAVFWAEVERVMPDYKEVRAVLKNYEIAWIFERIKLGR